MKEEQELAPFDPTKKKKKVVLLDPVEESQTDKSDSLPVNDGLNSSFVGLKKEEEPAEMSSLIDESVEAAEDLDENVNGEENEEAIVTQQQRYPWEGIDRDYSYEEKSTRTSRLVLGIFLKEQGVKGFFRG